MNLSRTRIFAAGLALAATLALTGCGAAEKVATSASAAEAVRLAGEQAADDSYAFEMTMTMDIDSFGEMEMGAEGAMDAATGRGVMVMDFLGMEAQTVIDGETVYVSLDGGEQWIKQPVDVQQLSGADGSGFDVTEQLAYLRMVSDEVAEVGTEKIRGVETTKYRGFVSIDAVLDQLSGDQRKEAEELRGLLEGDGFEMFVWVDAEGRPARVEFELEMEEAGEKATVAYRIDTFDWGREVDFELPPADKIVDMEDADYSSLFQ